MKKRDNPYFMILYTKKTAVVSVNFDNKKRKEDRKLYFAKILSISFPFRNIDAPKQKSMKVKMVIKCI